MQKRNFVELVSYREHGVKRSHRFLEYHRYLSAADSGHLFKRHSGYIVDLFFGFVFQNARFVPVLHGNGFEVTVFIENGISVFIEYGRRFDYDVSVFVGNRLIHGYRLSVFVLFEFRRLETDFALYYLPRGTLYKLHKRKAGYGFTATRFAYYAYHGIFGYRERYAVYRFGYTRVGEKVSVKIIELDYVTRIFHLRRIFFRVDVFTFLAFFEFFDERFVLLCYLARFFSRKIMFFYFRFSCFIRHNYLFILGSNASRSPSPTKLNERTARMIQIPTGIH